MWQEGRCDSLPKDLRPMVAPALALTSHRRLLTLYFNVQCPQYTPKPDPDPTSLPVGVTRTYPNPHPGHNPKPQTFVYNIMNSTSEPLNLLTLKQQ